jgi:hypothetical protein
VGVLSRAEVKTTREGGADRESTQRGRQRGGGKDNTDSRPAVSNSKERRESERTETKKERGEHTDIRHTMLS